MRVWEPSHYCEEPGTELDNRLMMNGLQQLSSLHSLFANDSTISSLFTGKTLLRVTLSVWCVSSALGHHCGVVHPREGPTDEKKKLGGIFTCAKLCNTRLCPIICLWQWNIVFSSVCIISLYVLTPSGACLLLFLHHKT